MLFLIMFERKLTLVHACEVAMRYGDKRWRNRPQLVAMLATSRDFLTNEGGDEMLNCEMSPSCRTEDKRRNRL
jgi:hypothetical protein